MEITLKFTGDTSIKEAYTKAINVSKTLGANVNFIFNGIYCVVHPELDVEDAVNTFFKSARSSQF